MADAPPHLQLLLPDLSGFSYAQLAEALPGLRATPLGIDIPLIDLGPEEALAVCLRLGVTCRGTRVVASPGAG
jgi:hypothetical protein